MLKQRMAGTNMFGGFVSWSLFREMSCVAKADLSKDRISMKEI